MNSLINFIVGVITAFIIVFILKYNMGELPSLLLLGIGFVSTALMFFLNPPKQ